MIDPTRLALCRVKLVETARRRGTITYSDLAKHIGVANQAVGPYLNAIYEEELKQGRPDITLVAVYQKSGFGRFNSRGGPAQSVKVDPNNPADVQAYRKECSRVYDQWSGI